MKKYEYKIKIIPTDQVEKHLNVMGKEGWKVVQLTQQAADTKVVIEKESEQMERKDCIKTKFASKEAAWFHIKKCQANSKRDKKPINAYLCGFCNTWHVTSRVDWKEQVASLTEENERLRIDNLAMKKILDDMQHDFKEKLAELTNPIRKKENLAIRADERVKDLQKKLSEKGELVAKLRKEKSELIMQVLSFKK